jgi:YVTN family beta-propeller protein
LVARFDHEIAAAPADGRISQLRAKKMEGIMKRCAAFLLSCAFAASAAGQTAAFVIGEKLSGSIGFYDANFNRIGDVKVGTHPHEIVLTPDGKTLYVADNGVMWMTETAPGDNTVSIVDIASMKRTATIDLGQFRRPHGITYDASTNRVYVTTEKPSRLLVLDPKSLKVIRTYDVKGQAPHIVKLGPKREWAYVSNTDTGTLAAIKLSSGEVISMPSGERPQGQAMSPDGRTIFVANSGGNSISIFDLEQKKNVGSITTKGKAPVRLVVSRDGKTLVYALQEGRTELAEIPLNGRPVSMSLSLDGKLAYCSVQEEDEVNVISVADRKVVRVVHLPKGTGPDPVVPLR